MHLVDRIMPKEWKDEHFEIKLNIFLMINYENC